MSYFKHKPPKRQQLEIKSLRLSSLLLAALTGQVSLKLRGSEIQTRARKNSDVLERFPKFLYDLFGASGVTVKIGNIARG